MERLTTSEKKEIINKTLKQLHTELNCLSLMRLAIPPSQKKEQISPIN